VRKLIKQLAKALIIYIVILAPLQLKAQTEYSYIFTIRNEYQPTDKILEFDLYIQDANPTLQFELNMIQAGIVINDFIYNGGTVTPSLVAGSTSELNSANRPAATNIQWRLDQNTIKVTAKLPAAQGDGTILSQTSPGTKVCRLRITNTVPFTSNSHANLTFSFTTIPFPTKVFITTDSELDGIIADLATTSNCFSTTDLILNPSATPPIAYAVIGGGSYCQGSIGMPVGVANSESGFTYTLNKNGVDQTPTITGTGSAISFGNQLYGVYTVSATNSGGTTPMTGSATITENAATATPTGTSIQSICAGTTPTIASLTATGTGTIRWYAAATGGPALATSAVLVTGNHYFASQTLGGCESTARFDVTVIITAPPTGIAASVFCSIESPTIANLSATGTAIKWYSVSGGGTALPTTTPLSTGTYYASQTVGGCESITRFSVAVTVNTTPSAPTGLAAQTFCSGTLPTVAGLIATGTSIKWYDAESAGNLLAGSTSLVNGTHYFASQTINGCESILRYEVTATVNVTPNAPAGSASQSLCSGVTATIASLTATGTAIKWYAAATGGAALATTTAVTNNTHYYASQTVTGCESSSRMDVTVTITAAPTGSAAQSFCSENLPTIANLAATGTGIQWYAAATGGTALASSAPLTTATTYYASQTISGCESIVRLSVTATVNVTPGAPTGTAAQTFCTGDLPTVVNLAAIGASIKWYSTSSGGSALATTTALVTGTHYYASQTTNACESSARFDVTATINLTPAAPTGSLTQSFCSGSAPTIASLSSTGTAIKWYAASSGGAALATTTALVNNVHYYASQTVDGCESLRLNVTAIVTTSLASSVSIAASANPVCTGTAVTLTATPVNAGTTPTYQWFKNTVAMGTGATYNYTPVNGDVVYVVLTSNAPCATNTPATSNSITMLVTSFVGASVTVVESLNMICAGTSVTFTPTPSGGGGTPTYQWFKNSVAVATSATYTYTPSNGDAIKAVMTSSLACATGSPATSNTITMAVNPTIATSVTIAVNNNNICSGTPATFTATPTGGGTPTYQWLKNNIAVSTGSTYAYTPISGDVIKVVMTSTATCATGSPATSNSITMVVNPNIPASVSVGVSQNNVCSGISVTFSATPTGGGTPTYQWYKNAIAVSTGVTYVTAPANGDVVYVVMTSSTTCSSGSPATSNSIAMVVNPLVGAAGAITGSALFTPGTTGVAYSIASIPNATSYIWTYSGTGVTINGSGTSVSLDFSAAATSGQITVKGRNACGDGAQSFINFLGAKTLNLTSVLLEGIYNGGGTMRQARNATGPQWPAGVADHIRVELHSDANYSTIVYTATDVPLSTTGSATISIPGNISDSYYITIRHRNSLETVSSTPVSFASGAISQSFGTPAKVFGSNLGISIDPGYYLIYAGDVNQDGIINTQDFTGIDSDSYNYVTGYLATDVDGNGAIDTNDYISIDNNNFNHIGAIRP